MNLRTLSAALSATLLGAAVFASQNPAAMSEPPTAELPDTLSAGSEPPRREQLTLALDVRADFHYESFADGGSSSGFSGEYLNILLDGTIAPRLSYHFRHRLNKYADAGNNIFNATDWIYLSYRPTERTTLSAGKLVVAIGGYEYDRAPIDLYFCSVYWNHISCYQFGLSAAFSPLSGNHSFTVQLCNSPFGEIGDGLYAYNLLWSGRMGSFSTLWSANLLEYAKGRYIAYLALGNSFEAGPFRAEFDFMNRASKHQSFWFRDMSLVGEASCFVHDKVKLLAKCGYDVNDTDYMFAGSDGTLLAPDRCVAPGTDSFFWGAGIEYFPLKHSRDLRLHAAWADTHDAEGRKMNFLSFGIRWRVNLYTRR